LDIFSLTNLGVVKKTVNVGYDAGSTTT